MKIEFDIHGLTDLEQILTEEMPKNLRRGVLNRAGRGAMQRVADRMAQLAPYDPEDRDEDGRSLRDSMKVELATAKFARRLGIPRSEGVVVLAGPAPKGRRARAAAASLEHGTGERFRKSGASTGALPAQPYARPAADAEAENVLNDIAHRIAVEIDKAAVRWARRQARLAAKEAAGG